MTRYIILIIFTVLVFSFFGAFLFGYTKGRVAEQKAQREDAQRRAESDKAFEAEKEKIREEVYGNAENEKAALSAGGTGGERFDRINDSLRDNKN
jgi:hypothetical protein